MHCMECVHKRNEIEKKDKQITELAAQWDEAFDERELLATQNEVLLVYNEDLLAEVEKLQQQLAAATSKRPNASEYIHHSS